MPGVVELVTLAVRYEELIIEDEICGIFEEDTVILTAVEETKEGERLEEEATPLTVVEENDE